MSEVLLYRFGFSGPRVENPMSVKGLATCPLIVEGRILPSIPLYEDKKSLQPVLHARPFVGVSPSQFFRDLVNFWR